MILRSNPAPFLHSLVAPLGLVCALAACGAEAPVAAEPKPAASATALPASTAAANAATASATPPAPPLPDVTFVAGTNAPAPEKAPKLRIVAPKSEQVVPTDKAGDLEVKLELSGWDVPAGGNHVHVILDGRPYKRIDDAKAPIKLKDLDPSYTLGEGQHVLVAFPSRPTHESVKPIGKDVPLAVTTFWIGKKGAATWKPTDPTFVFSRPKGANDGAPPAEGILVDWYLANVELGEGKHSIEAVLRGPGIDGEKKASIRQWVPWRLQNPRDGEYQLRMTLLDRDGKPVSGAWNDVSRTFTVNTKAASNAHTGHAGHAGHAAPASSSTPSAAPSASSAPAAK
jgi:hypothetical protein